MVRSMRHDALFKEYASPGITAADLLAKLSVEGGLSYDSRIRAFRRLRTDTRLRYIRGYLRERLVSGVISRA